MQLTGRHVVVTGGGNGIGAALARRAHQEGARAVVVADLDGARATQIAAELNEQRPKSSLGVAVDVTTEAANASLIAEATIRFGTIDVFFANAGVALGTDLAGTSEIDWTTAFDVNVHAHRWAAKHLLPGWLERGEGYFVATASAAGLLAQIGSGPYSVTKHAAVAFAEWLSITYGDQGIRVSCLCPQGVNTNMLQGHTPEAIAGADVVRASGPVLEPTDVAEVMVRGLADERFLLLPHPEVHDFLQRKAVDVDRWLQGMRRLQARVVAARGPA